jgi:dihydrofolate synthase/folylpolyglutamate synthase
MEMLELPSGATAILDGAHNPHAARALARALGSVARVRMITVLGMSEGKDAEGIVGALAPHADAVVATRSRQDRAMAPEAVARVVSSVRPDLQVPLVPNAADAVARACGLAGQGDLVVVAGSLFVVGEAREHLCGVQPDAVALSDPLPRRGES